MEPECQEYGRLRQRTTGPRRRKRSRTPTVRVSSGSQATPAANRDQETEQVRRSDSESSRDQSYSGKLHQEGNSLRNPHGHVQDVARNRFSLSPVWTSATKEYSSGQNDVGDQASKADPARSSHEDSHTGENINKSDAQVCSNNERERLLKRSPSANNLPLPTSLWTIGLIERTSDIILRLVESLARAWLDEQGHNPLGRFVKADDPSKSICPSKRVLVFIMLGFLLSAGMVYLTEDQYIQGPLLSDEHGMPLDRITNATDFPVHIAFRNVGCEISSRPGPVLDKVTGAIRPGTLTAILGRSGSGKTTLANLILGRSRKFCDRQFGRVYMNGRPRSLEVILDRVGFVPQDDVLYPELTVEQTLRFSAETRLPRTASVAYKNKVLEELLEMLGLQHLRNIRIGMKGAGGISGGEAKRVSIGVELITQPSILIMDEPTSGLDSAAAYHIVRMLRRVADSGVAVVAVLHQPTTRIYNLLNDTILLQDGRPVYVGPREEVLDYFKMLGFDIPAFERPTLSSCPLESSEQDKDQSSLNSNYNGTFTTSEHGQGLNTNQTVQTSKRFENHTAKISTSTSTSLKPRADDALFSEMSVEVSPPEFLLDILAGFVKPSRPPGRPASGSNEEIRLDALWAQYGNVEARWRDIEIGMDRLRREEQDRVQRLFSGDESTGKPPASRNLVIEHFGLESCDDNYPSVLRFWCYILWGLGRDPGDPSYPVRPKPGLFYQVYLWFMNFCRIAWNRGFLIEAFIVASLASIVAFTRSYNVTWNRRALGGFFISISLTLSGMLGALFNDDIGPVRRAADSGMTLGAYEFAMIIFIFLKAMVICHLYAVVYFTVLYLRRGYWCSSPYSGWLYFEFTHLLHELYMCAHTMGSLICVISDHNLYQAYLMGLIVFICVHTFAFFAPSQNQIREDALLFGRINSAPLINFFCSLSFVRYFMEAFLLWEPLDDDTVGRNTALRFYGYHQKRKSTCFTSLFAIWLFYQAARFLLFARYNRNVFNSLHDTPLFIIFVSKVAISFLSALIIMTFVHELPRVRAIFLKARVQQFSMTGSIAPSPSAPSSAQ